MSLHDGTLRKIDDKENKKIKGQHGGRYCIFKHEECIFPGRIIVVNGETFKTSVMQKTYAGWTWPAKPEILTCHQRCIVSYVNDNKIIKTGDSYQIEDQFHYMEWGD